MIDFLTLVAVLFLVYMLNDGLQGIIELLEEIRDK